MQGRLVFALGILLLGSVSAAQAAPSLSLPTINNVAVGSDVTFPVTMTVPTGESVGGIVLRIQYDPAVLSILQEADVTKGPRAGTFILVTNLLPLLTITDPPTAAGVRMVFYGTSSIGGGSGVLVNLKFRVVGLGSSPLFVTLCGVNDPLVACTPIQHGSFSTNVCTPTTETCNGQDDDCNGQIDNGFNVGAACSVGVGACQRNGVQHCTANGSGTTCTAIPGEPSGEGPFSDASCNDGVDNDCDGQTDATDADCLPPALDSFIPGGGSAATDCMVEWEIANLAPAVDKKGIPLAKQACVDGDPCDGDGVADGTCTFLISTCMNVFDTRLTNPQGNPVCTASSVASIDVKGLPDELTAALVHLGGSMGGQCLNPGDKKGFLCQQNSDCDTPNGSGNGKCRGQFVVFAQPLTEHVCTEPPTAVEAPLAKARVSLRANAVSAPNAQGRSAKDRDRLQLICLPSE